ncbi:MAG TPA: outer membrane lipoprotein-sorting protein [Spirochaetota bacterium]|nr:outer membrane lipoprotein-sorting protein [Spirochaetota bacterium]HPI90755.1 outer membrane lipoprotein-sorting protein [Spirochaetota bacterium]HPR49370.1 outer membrane lipoprotein-sorting protein [Spirochaetota bacterium]
MKKIALSLAILLCCSLASRAEDLTGKQIADIAEKKNQSATGLVSTGTIVLEDLKTNKKETRSFTLLGLLKGGLRNAAFRFTDSRYKDTTFLTMEKNDGDKLQYIYLKSVGSPRQVESSDKEKNFVDTDMSYEDMGGSKTADYDYQRLDDKQVNNRDCYVIEKFPKNKSSKYQKHLILIDREYWVPVAAKFYSTDGRVVKTLAADDVRQVANGIYLPFSLTVTDIAEQHRTTVQLKNAAEKPLNQGYFNKSRMNKSWAE